MTVCMQCAMKAMLANEPAPTFPEDPEEHVKKYHPDPIETHRERRELEEKLAARMARAGSAKNN